MTHLSIKGLDTGDITDFLSDKNDKTMKGEPQIKLSLAQRIRLEILGVTPTERRKRPGWRGELQFYAFKCPIHGVVEDYPHGYQQTLRCGKCSKNQ